MADIGPSKIDVEARLFNPPDDVKQSSHCPSMDAYRAMYACSIDDPAGFWGEIAEHFYWKKPPSKEDFFEFNFDPTKGPVKIKWMPGAVTNVCYNVLDRHVNNGLGDRVAFYW